MKIDKDVPIPPMTRGAKYSYEISCMEAGDSMGGFPNKSVASTVAITIRRHRGKQTVIRKELGKNTYRVWMLDKEFTPSGRKRRSKK
jgi:hypothetical protein